MKVTFVLTLAEITDTARSFVIPVGSKVRVLGSQPDGESILIEWDRRVIVASFDELVGFPLAKEYERVDS